MQEVAALELHHPQFLDAQCARQRGIPHPLGGVERIIGVSTAAVGREFGVEIEAYLLDAECLGYLSTIVQTQVAL